MEWWQRDGLTLEDMVRHKLEFLENPGCNVDFTEIYERLDAGDDADESDVPSMWFDHLVEQFRARATFTLHRHMTVVDFDSYVAGLEAGTETVGVHWSMDETTSSPYPEQARVDIGLKGEIDASQVEWFTTFQMHFSHPYEQQVSFDGPIRIEWIMNLETGETYRPRQEAYQICPEDDPAFVP